MATHSVNSKPSADSSALEFRPAIQDRLFSPVHGEEPDQPTVDAPNEAVEVADPEPTTGQPASAVTLSATPPGDSKITATRRAFTKALARIFEQDQDDTVMTRSTVKVPQSALRRLRELQAREQGALLRAGGSGRVTQTELVQRALSAYLETLPNAPLASGADGQPLGTVTVTAPAAWWGLFAATAALLGTTQSELMTNVLSGRNLRAVRS